MNADDAEKFTATASSAQTPLIVFLAEKLTAPLCFLLPKKPIGLFGDPVFRRTQERFGYFVARASSPKRVRRTMKRGEDGAAVKISVPLQGTRKFWEPQEG